MAELESISICGSFSLRIQTFLTVPGVITGIIILSNCDQFFSDDPNAIEPAAQTLGIFTIVSELLMLGFFASTREGKSIINATFCLFRTFMSDDCKDLKSIDREVIGYEEYLSRLFVIEVVEFIVHIVGIILAAGVTCNVAGGIVALDVIAMVLCVPLLAEKFRAWQGVEGTERGAVAVVV